MSYPGAKSNTGAWQTIIGQIPATDWFIEGFAGSAQITRRMRPARMTYLFDVSVEAVERLCLDFDSRTGLYIERCNFVAWLSESKFERNTTAVIYCDPPYPLSTRNGREYYEHEMTDADHAALISALLQSRARVLLSGVRCPLYDAELKAWRRIDYRVKWHKKTAIESLWCNFPEPTELQDWRFAGRNYRDRWRMEKLRRNVLAKLKRMQPRQRGFVLNAINDAYPVSGLTQPTAFQKPAVPVS